MIVICDRCKGELKAPGGLIFSPPSHGVVRKIHLCTKCFYVLIKKLNLGMKGGNEMSKSRIMASNMKKVEERRICLLGDLKRARSAIYKIRRNLDVMTSDERYNVDYALTLVDVLINGRWGENHKSAKQDYLLRLVEEATR